MKGTLYLLPNTISDGEWQAVIPQGVKDRALPIRHFIVENIRTARRYLRKIGYTANFDTEVIFFELNKHTKQEDIPSFLEPLKQGENMAIISESGLPCVADPGNIVVELAQSYDINIKPLVGPSSIFLSLMASGFNGQNFSFIGYLPIENSLKLKSIKNIESKIYKENQTQIFIEAPYRNQKLLEFIIQNCQPSTKLCIAREVSADNELIKTKTIAQWKKHKVDIQKQNTIFLLYK
ncbi:MAG: SAM-dependent methyltransferase [Bacteroidales bacterium]|nr:SAM-dependent methyltransferase [Bacteroidales bacterium]